MSVVTRALDRIENLSALDRPAGALQRWWHRVLPDTPRIDAPLRGSWLGHPLHPVLVVGPIGAWLSAGLLDLARGQQDAARRLVLAGLVAAGPTAVTGAMDYRQLATDQRRVGLVHLLANLTAVACYTASYSARRRGGTGHGSAVLGLAAVSLGGMLGGHLTYAQGSGVFRWQPERAGQPIPPAPERQPIVAGGRGS